MASSGLFFVRDEKSERSIMLNPANEADQSGSNAA